MSAESNILIVRPGVAGDAWHNFLDEPLISPTQGELRDAFAQSVMPGYDVISVEGLFGALTKPERQPDGYAFIDLDDVVADLSSSLRDLEYGSQLPPHMRGIIMIMVKICPLMTVKVISRHTYLH